MKIHLSYRIMPHGQRIMILTLAGLFHVAINAQDTLTNHRPPMDSVVHKIQEVVVSTNQMLGIKFQARNRTGSAYYVSPEELGKFNYSDINRMLKAVPGVNLYEE